METRRLIIGAALAAAIQGQALAQQVPLADPIPGPIPASPVQVGLETVMTGLMSCSTWPRPSPSTAIT
ncbi:hypothetical protein GCM10025794_12650 [Massilia kyonggiensis]